MCEAVATRKPPERPRVVRGVETIARTLAGGAAPIEPRKGAPPATLLKDPSAEPPPPPPKLTATESCPPMGLPSVDGRRGGSDGRRAPPAILPAGAAPLPPALVGSSSAWLEPESSEPPPRLGFIEPGPKPPHTEPPPHAEPPP